MQLKHYQQSAIKRLMGYYESYIPNSKILLIAPTGAGKTVIGGNLIKTICERTPNVTFIWISIGKSGLHQQSKYKVSKFFPELVSYTPEDIMRRNKMSLEDKEILFMNWEAVASKSAKTGKWLNLFMQDSDTVNLVNLIQNTKSDGLRIILLVDEAHSKGASVRSKEILNLIGADVTFNITATPRPEQIEESEDQIVEIDSKSVIEEGVIKRALVVNKGIKDSDDVITSILDVAYRRREQLKSLYAKEGSKVNPLCIIQVPNGEDGVDIVAQVESFFDKKGITQQNEKLAIWLSQDKINIKSIEQLDATQEYLIFKQAIDTGWDCPRAQILVKFREVKSEIFSKQVIGRILRMPELKHYKSKDLNQAYIFTNEEYFHVDKPSELPSALTLPTESIRLKKEFEEVVSYTILPTFPYIKLNSMCETRSIMIDFSRYLHDKVNDFVESYRKSGEVITSHIPINLVMELSSENITIQSNRNVKFSISSLEHIITMGIKNVMKDDKETKGIVSYIIGKKPEGVSLQEYLESMVYNLNYLIDKLEEMKNYYTVHPTVNAYDVNVEYVNIPTTLSVNIAPQENETFDKLIYEYFPYRLASKKDKIIIEELEQDENVEWWFYNRTFSYTVGIPVIREGDMQMYKPRYIIKRNNKLIALDYSTSEENLEQISHLLEFWREKAAFPVYDYDLRVLA